MKYTRTRGFTIKLQEYESHTFSCSVTVEDSDLSEDLQHLDPDAKAKEMRLLATDYVDADLSGEIAVLQDLSRNPQSIIHLFEAATVSDEPEAPAAPATPTPTSRPVRRSVKR